MVKSTHVCIWHWYQIQVKTYTKLTDSVGYPSARQDFVYAWHELFKCVLPASIKAAPADNMKTDGVGDIAWAQSGRGLPTGSRVVSSAPVEGSPGVAPPTTSRNSSEIR